MGWRHPSASQNSRWKHTTKHDCRKPLKIGFADCGNRKCARLTGGFDKSYQVKDSKSPPPPPSNSRCITYNVWPPRTTANFFATLKSVIWRTGWVERSRQSQSALSVSTGVAELRIVRNLKSRGTPGLCLLSRNAVRPHSVVVWPRQLHLPGFCRRVHAWGSVTQQAPDRWLVNPLKSSAFRCQIFVDSSQTWYDFWESLSHRRAGEHLYAPAFPGSDPPDVSSLLCSQRLDRFGRVHSQCGFDQRSWPATIPGSCIPFSSVSEAQKG